MLILPRRRAVMMDINHAVTIRQAAAVAETIISVKLKSQDIRVAVMELPRQVVLTVNILIVQHRHQITDRVVEAAAMMIVMAQVSLRECTSRSQKLAMSVQLHQSAQVLGHQLQASKT